MAQLEHVNITVEDAEKTALSQIIGPMVSSIMLGSLLTIWKSRKRIFALKGMSRIPIKSTNRASGSISMMKTRSNMKLLSMTRMRCA